MGKVQLEQCEEVDGEEKRALSYSQKFRNLKGCKDHEVTKTAQGQSSREAQAAELDASRIFWSDIYTKAEQRPLLNLPTNEVKPIVNNIVRTVRLAVLTSMHIIALFIAPRYFTWTNLGLAWLSFTVYGIFGVTLGYHRLLTHRSFKCHKWFEYLCAFMGVQAAQGDPVEWVCHHRYHHLHTDTPLDPHSPYEGFWYSHIGWLLKTEVWMLEHDNAKDLTAQWFYRFMEVAWLPWLWIVKPLITYKLGGMAAICWTIAVPMVYGWHTTFFVNSAAHIWGRRPYDTGDLSTNCWWVALMSFGEGWHNSHHAFPYSARHGLEWWEFDPTWYLICLLEKCGLVWDVQVPNEKVKAAKRANDLGEDTPVIAVIRPKAK